MHGSIVLDALPIIGKPFSANLAPRRSTSLLTGRCPHLVFHSISPFAFLRNQSVRLESLIVVVIGIAFRGSSFSCRFSFDEKSKSMCIVIVPIFVKLLFAMRRGGGLIQQLRGGRDGDGWNVDVTWR